MKEIDVINNLIQSYDDFFGLNFNQVELIPLCLKFNIFNSENVESVLNIILFESFDNSDCYIDSKKEYVNAEYIRSNPDELRTLVVNYENYY